MSDIFQLWIPKDDDLSGPFFGVDRSPPDPAPEGCCRRWPAKYDGTLWAALGHVPKCSTGAEEEP